MLLSTGMLAFTFTATRSAQSFADAVFRRELRIQARLNAISCLETGLLMLAKDVFFAVRTSTTSIADFGCILVSVPGESGLVTMSAVAVISGVTARGFRDMRVEGSNIVIEREEVY